MQISTTTKPDKNSLEQNNEKRGLKDLNNKGPSKQIPNDAAPLENTISAVFQICLTIH